MLKSLVLCLSLYDDISRDICFWYDDADACLLCRNVEDFGSKSILHVHIAKAADLPFPGEKV